MKYCSKCGNELFDEAVMCVKCGCMVENANNTNLSYSEWYRTLTFKERYIMTLGGMIPILGLIFFCVNINTNPRYAKWCGINALMMFVIYFIIIVLFML